MPDLPQVIPAFVLRVASHLDSFATKFIDRRADVIAHESQLVADAALDRRPLIGVDCEFSRRQAEDEPSIARADVLEGKSVRRVSRNASAPELSKA